ncbi:MAG: ABC transporter substrate-binding protein [Nannocystaceae bacterium]
MSRLLSPSSLPLAALLVCGALAPSQAQGAPSPATAVSASPSALGALERHHKRLSDMVKAKAKQRDLQAVVDPMLDYHWLAEATLGGSSRAPSVCGERCVEFEGLLQRLVRRNYLRLIEDAAGRPVSFEGQVAGKNHVFKVTTKVTTVKNGRTQSMTIAYVMHESDGTFTVRDIITDGVSLVRTYRYEFRTMARDGGIARIIDNLKSKLAAG